MGGRVTKFKEGAKKVFQNHGIDIVSYALKVSENGVVCL